MPQIYTSVRLELAMFQIHSTILDPADGFFHSRHEKGWISFWAPFLKNRKASTKRNHIGLTKWSIAFWTSAVRVTSNLTQKWNCGPTFFPLNFASILKSSFAKNSLYGIRLMLPSSTSRRLRFSKISCWCYKTLFFFGGGGNLDFPPNKEIENKIVLVFKPALKYENNEANFKQI